MFSNLCKLQGWDVSRYSLGQACIKAIFWVGVCLGEPIFVYLGCKRHFFLILKILQCINVSDLTGCSVGDTDTYFLSQISTICNRMTVESRYIHLFNAQRIPFISPSRRTWSRRGKRPSWRRSSTSTSARTARSSSRQGCQMAKFGSLPFLGLRHGIEWKRTNFVA